MTRLSARHSSRSSRSRIGRFDPSQATIRPGNAPAASSGTASGAECTSDSCYKTHWGAGIGFNLNQANAKDATAGNFTSASSSGVTYALDFLPSDLRMVVGDSTTDYCVNVTSASGTIPWSKFNSTCWNSSGKSLSGPPANFVSVRFQIVADTSYGNDTDFYFCVSKLSL